MAYKTYDDACRELLDIAALLKAKIKDAGRTMADRDNETVQLRAACWTLFNMLKERRNNFLNLDK